MFIVVYAFAGFDTEKESGNYERLLAEQNTTMPFGNTAHVTHCCAWVTLFLSLTLPPHPPPAIGLPVYSTHTVKNV